MNIVLIADRVENHSDSNIFSKDLEKLEDVYFNPLYDALVKLYDKVFEYQSPSDFINNIQKHKKDLVFTLWSGESSRNRRALIPSICEAYDINYIGADSYVNIICQDKALSKQMCKKVNMLTPNFRLVENISELNIIDDLSLPLVIKPNFEGGSIGISQKNLVYTYDDAKQLIKELLNIFHQSIIVEEFIEGTEVSFVCQGNKNEVKFIEAMKIELDNDSLEKTIYSYEIKKQKNMKTSQSLITTQITKNIINQVKELFILLGKVDILRVDGRLVNNQFYCIEITPDISLSKNGTFAKAFEFKDISYEQMLETIVNDVHQFDLNQNANKTLK